MKTKNNARFSLREYAVILILSVLASLTSCQKGNGSGAFADNRPAGYGNTPGNIGNGLGEFVQDENYVYYCSYDDDKNLALYKSSSDFEETVLLGNIRAFHLNVLNNWIYYENGEDNSTVYKIETDGQNNQKISDIQSVNNLTAIDDKLYFILIRVVPDDISISDGIYVMDTDGNNLKQLTDLGAGQMYIYDGVIYFKANRAENYGSDLYKMNLDGTGQTRLSLEYVGINNFVVYNGYIYYHTMTSNLYKISVDGGRPEIAVPMDEGIVLGKINICGNTLFYSFTANTLAAQLASDGIHALNLDTGEDKRLIPKRANDIFIINNQIYFMNNLNHYITYYSMDLNGSNLKELWSWA